MVFIGKSWKIWDVEMCQGWTKNLMENSHSALQFGIFYNKIVIWIIKKTTISHMIIKMRVTEVYSRIIYIVYHDNQIITVDYKEESR